MRLDNELGFMDSLRSGMAGACSLPESLLAPPAAALFDRAGTVGAMNPPVLREDEAFVWEEPVFDVRAGDAARAQPLPAPPGVIPALPAEPLAFDFASVKGAPALPAGDLPHFEWDMPASPVAKRGPEGTAALHVHPVARTPALRDNATKTAPTDPLRARIRERYFAVRFPGAPAGAAAKEPSEFIKVARLYFEDDDAERAVELLQYAVEALPGEERLWLARLEILFLARRADAFVELAREFQKRFPDTKAWPQVARLGFLLAPKEMVFSAGRPTGQSVDEHYGAWPESPNWIEAPWDLTGEVLAVELRGRILGTARPVVRAP